QSNQEVHYHDKRHEPDNGADAADDAFHQQGLQEGGGAGHQGANPLFESVNPANKEISDERADSGLGNVKYKPHHNRKNRNAKPAMCNNSVHFVLFRVLCRLHLSGFHLGYQLIDKSKTLAIGLLYGLLIMKIDVILYIGSGLAFALRASCRLNGLCQSLM